MFFCSILASFLHMFFILKTMCIAITESVYVFHQPRRSVSTRFRSANEILVKIWEDQSNFGPEVDLPIKTQGRVFKFSMYIHEANNLYRVQPKICPPYWISSQKQQVHNLWWFTTKMAACYKNGRRSIRAKSHYISLTMRISIVFRENCLLEVEIVKFCFPYHVLEKMIS